MFKKITLYRITAGVPASADLLADALERSAFVPTAPTQELSTGWVPPRATSNQFAESIAGQWVACFTVETRKVPADALDKRTNEMVDKVEADTGRKPGRRERRDIKADALLELLPTAFPKQAHVDVWISPTTGLMVVGSTSTGQTDALISSLVRSIDGFTVHMVATNTTPATLMNAWLTAGESAAPGFELGRDCVLQAADETRAAVLFSRHALHTDEIKKLVTEGKLPQRLGLVWQSRICFTLTDTLKLLGVKFLEFDRTREDDTDAFDADVTLTTGELSRLLPELIDALGGELQQ